MPKRADEVNWDDPMIANKNFECVLEDGKEVIKVKEDRPRPPVTVIGLSVDEVKGIVDLLKQQIA
jgi:hypothetical protein